MLLCQDLNGVGPEYYVLLIFYSVLHREFERFAFQASSIKNC